MKCPKCGKETERLLALSRRDNKTMICEECGITEALEDFAENIIHEQTCKDIHAEDAL